jgi:hypothetical protein
MQLSDWLLVEVALLLIGLTKISFVKNWLGRLGRDQLSFRLSALDGAQDRELAANRSPSPTLREDNECFTIYLSQCMQLSEAQACWYPDLYQLGDPS